MGSIPTTRKLKMKNYQKNKRFFSTSVSKEKSEEFSSVNIITNITGYFCKKGKREILETKFKEILFKRASSGKKPIKLGTCLNTLIANTLSHIKLKPKKGRNRRNRQKAKKNFLVYPIDRITSKRKAYINFFTTFKGVKQQNKPFISRFEVELESIYAHVNKRVQSGLSKYILTEKRDNLHKSAFKYIPYF